MPYRPRREITAAGFNGGTDATDDRVLWVEADNLEQIEQVVAGLGAQVHGDPACEAGEIEFHMPTYHEALHPSDDKDDLIRTMLGMLRDLHNNYGWDELGATLEEVEDLAEDLGITDEE